MTRKQGIPVLQGGEDVKAATATTFVATRIGLMAPRSSIPMAAKSGGITDVST